MRSLLAISAAFAAALVATACGAPVPADDGGPPSLSRARFHAMADGVARRSASSIGASGASLISDDGIAHPWARLDPENRGRDRGGYLLADGDHVWLVRYQTDGRTEPWDGSDGARAITHTQEHHHGHETIVFALRGGAPVVLDYELLEDTEDGEPVVHHYARDGVCTTPCPLLRDYPTLDARIEVLGPATNVDDLLR